MNRSRREKVLSLITIVSLFFGFMGFFTAWNVVQPQAELISDCNNHYEAEIERICQPRIPTLTVREQLYNFSINFSKNEVID